jgi:hypothetical protein
MIDVVIKPKTEETFIIVAWGLDLKCSRKLVMRCMGPRMLMLISLVCFGEVEICEGEGALDACVVD